MVATLQPWKYQYGTDATGDPNGRGGHWTLSVTVPTCTYVLVAVLVIEAL